MTEYQPIREHEKPMEIASIPEYVEQEGIDDLVSYVGGIKDMNRKNKDLLDKYPNQTLEELKELRAELLAFYTEQKQFTDYASGYIAAVSNPPELKK